MGSASEIKVLLDTHIWPWYLLGAWIRNARQTLCNGITFAIALRSRSLALSHQDPAGRFIGATSIEMKAPLLTMDERLRACPDLRCL